MVNATNSETSIVTGLLPNVWGMTLKAPTANGLDVSMRLGLYTHMNGGENALVTVRSIFVKQVDQYLVFSEQFYLVEVLVFTKVMLY